MPKWDEKLLPDQKLAAGHYGSHARLLAGPGTGKTTVLASRVIYLVDEQGVDPASILALTFTRFAARELFDRFDKALGSEVADQLAVSTLHSFALRQLLKNSGRLDSLPQPLRIVSRWERRFIVDDDIKRLLKIDQSTVQELFRWLASDWNTTKADDGNSASRAPDAKFIGTWQLHRAIYGYTLLDELVYQLKRGLENYGDFDIGGPWEHVLVDEYQDLNKCDIGVIHQLESRGAEIYGSGDDDQSIYSFRMAYPDGIRNFLQEYQPSSPFNLGICVRCRQKIVDISDFVASLDTDRVEKPKLTALDQSEPGDVHLLSFSDNETESTAIVRLCSSLLSKQQIEAKEILILVRSDRYGIYSKPLVEALTAAGIAVNQSTGGIDVDRSDAWAEIWALLRLTTEITDSLAWRALLQLRKNDVGTATIQAIETLAKSKNTTFSSAMREIEADESLITKGNKVATDVKAIDIIISGSRATLLSNPDTAGIINVIDSFESTLRDREDKDEVVGWIKVQASDSESTNMEELVDFIESQLVDLGPPEDTDGVSVMTMHKAKGLTATAVIIAGVEDEILPMRDDEKDSIDDDRRLLYVSLTRARNHLFMTFVGRRYGSQMRSGRTLKAPRTLTRFLRDSPVRPESGIDFINSM